MASVQNPFPYLTMWAESDNGLLGYPKAQIEARSTWRRQPYIQQTVSSLPDSLASMVTTLSNIGFDANSFADLASNINEADFDDGEGGTVGGHRYLTEPSKFNTGDTYDNCVAAWTAIHTELASSFPYLRIHHYGYPRPYFGADHAQQIIDVLASDHYAATLAPMTAFSLEGYLWDYDNYDTGNATETAWKAYYQAYIDLCIAMDANDGVVRPRSVFLWHRQSFPRFRLSRHDHVDEWLWTPLKDQVDSWILWGIDADLWYYDHPSHTADLKVELAIENPDLDVEDRDAVIAHCGPQAVEWAVEAARRLESGASHSRFSQSPSYRYTRASP